MLASPFGVSCATRTVRDSRQKVRRRDRLVFSAASALLSCVSERVGRAMPDDVVLTAEPRSDRGSGAAGRLRREGRLPAIVYGLGAEPTSVTVATHDLDLILAHGVNTLITLLLDGDDLLALARQVQRHPVR